MTFDQCTMSSNYAVASRLYRLMRVHHTGLPDDQELTGDLLRVRPVEAVPGRSRLDARRGAGIGLGDATVALSYAALAPVNTGELGVVLVAVPAGRMPSRALENRPRAPATGCCCTGREA